MLDVVMRELVRQSARTLDARAPADLAGLLADE